MPATFKQFNEEAMQPEEFLADAQKAAKFLQTEVTKLFPKHPWQVNADVSTNLGDALFLSIWDLSKESTKVTNLNSHAYVRFIMHLSSSFGTSVAKPKFSFELLNMSYQARDHGVKFRKITAKSPMDASKKLLAWVKKNKSLLETVPEETVR